MLALAALFQASSLVKELAWTGRVSEPQAFETSINSLLYLNSDSVLDIYGDSKALTLGLDHLKNMFNVSKSAKDQEIARYTLSLLHLERRLIKNKSMLQIIQQGIERAKEQATHFSVTHENVIANLSSIYTDTLSTFHFRIHVTGEPIHLNRTDVFNKIRALLLAGIRAAVLWRQLGGNRWQLLFARALILKEIDKLS